MNAKCIAVIGDSIVYGRVDNSGGWVRRLRTWHESKNLEFNTVFNLGISGNTIDNIAFRIGVECRSRNPDIILLSFGTNDSRRMDFPTNPNTTPISVFKDRLEGIIEICLEFTTKILFVGIIPVNEKVLNPYKSKYYYLVDDQREYNLVTGQVCSLLNIPHLNIFEQWLNLSENEFKSLLSDGLHPNSKGHEYIFSVVKSYIIIPGIL